MQRSPVCQLPYILPSQAQKHVTHNEAIRRLDALVQIRVTNMEQTAPPAGPSEGAAVIVGDGATGDFAGRDRNVATFEDGAWAFVAPRPGLIAFVESDGAFVGCDGTNWRPLLSGPFSMLGVNATADTTNRLVVSAEASLFGHAGTDHRLAINKAADGDTASVVFQSGYSGRAEFGLVGDNDFQLKISSDGSTFRQALVIDGASGSARFPNGLANARQRLTADRTYHVDPTGSDTNDGLAAGSAFATIQHAIDTALELDCAGFDVTIQLAAGTYSGQISLSRPMLGTDRLTILGDTATPGNVLLDHSSHLVSVQQGAWLVVKGVALQTHIWGSALYVGSGGSINIGAVEFRDVVRMHMEINGMGTITVVGDYTITGDALSHYRTSGSGASIQSTNITATLSDSPAFSSSFASATGNSSIILWSAAFTGSATGKTFDASANGTITAAGPARTDFPGTIAGTTESGGQYLTS